MFPIVATERLTADVQRLEVAAPRIARKQRPGQFVIIRTHSHGERIPLTIAGAAPDRGTITLVVQGVGKTTKLALAAPLLATRIQQFRIHRSANSSAVLLGYCCRKARTRWAEATSAASITPRLSLSVG